MMKLANRMQFGIPEESSLGQYHCYDVFYAVWLYNFCMPGEQLPLSDNDILLLSGDGLGEGYGMLGQAGSGKLRVSAGQSKLAAKVAKKYVIFVLSPV